MEFSLAHVVGNAIGGSNTCRAEFLFSAGDP